MSSPVVLTSPDSGSGATSSCTLLTATGYFNRQIQAARLSFTVEDVPEDPDAPVLSSMSITPLAVAVNSGTSWAAQGRVLVFTLESAGGIPSFGAPVRHATTVGNILSSTQKNLLFQFFKESRGLVRLFKVRSLWLRLSLTIRKGEFGISGCKCPGIPYSEVNSEDTLTEKMVDTASLGVRAIGDDAGLTAFSCVSLLGQGSRHLVGIAVVRGPRLSTAMTMRDSGSTHRGLRPLGPRVASVIYGPLSRHLKSYCWKGDPETNSLGTRISSKWGQLQLLVEAFGAQNLRLSTLKALRAKGVVGCWLGAKLWRQFWLWLTTPCLMARVLVMAHNSMVRAKASRLWLTTPLNSGAIPNLVPNSVFLNFFSMARAYGTTTPSAQEMGDQGYDAYTLDEALSKIGFGKFQVGVLAYAGLGWIAEAMEMTLLSFVGPAIQPQWGLSSSQESLISTVAFGGMLVGAYSWGVVSDSYGRKILLESHTVVVFLCKYALGIGLGKVREIVSPRYLCTQGRLTDAHYILANGATLNSKDLPKGLLVSDHINESTNEGQSSESTTSLSSTKNESNNCHKKTLSIVMLLSPNLTRTTLLLWFLYFGNTFSYYGIVLLTSQLSVGQSECDPTTLLSHNIKDSSLYVNVFITSLAELPGLALAAFILDRVGRKISMEIMLVAGFVLLLPLVVHQNAIMTTGFLFGARMFISASFIVACIYAPEVYPTNLRATGVGIATAISRIGGMVCPLIAVGMGSNCHQTIPVVLFEVTILLSDVTVMLLPFETNGKELADTLDLPVQHVQVE
ncbi:organic cation/carnitine transporter 7-like protein [Tanacetum coccineum]